MRWRYLALSVSLHLGLLLIFIIKKLPPPKPPLSQPIEVEILAAPPVPSKKVSISKRGGSGGRTSSGRLGRLSVKDLKPKFQIIKGGDSTQLTEGISDYSTTGWGKRANNLEELVYAISYQKLHTKIDGALFYPSILVQHDHQGTVNLQIEMNKNGCVEPWRYFEGSNRYLKSYVRQMFERKICKSEFLNHVLDEESRFIDFSFSFELNETGSSRFASRPVHGNLLKFERAVQKSRMEWSLGPIKGFGIVPAVSLDFFWLQEQWDKRVNKKNQLDQFKD